MAAGLLVITSLQKRLLSSIEAFARTLGGAPEGPRAKAAEAAGTRLRLRLAGRTCELLREAPGADDERARRAHARGS